MDHAIEVAHVYSTGPVQTLGLYLSRNCPDFIFIGHPFYLAAGLPSFVRHYSSGLRTSEFELSSLRPREPFSYFVNLLSTVFCVASLKKEAYCYFGVDPLNALAGLILRKLNLVQKVVYYTIDLPDIRFRNPFLNTCYRIADSYCVVHSDVVWNLSDEMRKARARGGRVSSTPQVTVPVGTLGRHHSLDFNRRRSSLVYLGTLREGQGLQFVIRSLPRLSTIVPDISLTVVGDGPLRSLLEDEVARLGLSSRVTFAGFIPEDDKVEGILVESGVGLAVYEPNSTGLTERTEPTKPKTYMACGLPVVITRVPKIAQDIENARAGVVIDFDETQFVNAIRRLVNEVSFYQETAKNAAIFASRYDLSLVYSTALKESGLSK